MFGIKWKTSVTFLLAIASLVFSACNDDKVPEEPIVGADAGQIPDEPGSGNVSFTAQTVYFAYDSDILSSDSQSSLNSLAEHLKSTQAAIQVEGHCDERGSTQYNLALGERRAQSVKQYLMEMGVDGAKVSIISYGEEKPAVEGHDESAWSQNRRAEFTISG